jgi:hypothetical protein
MQVHKSSRRGVNPTSFIQAGKKRPAQGDENIHKNRRVEVYEIMTPVAMKQESRWLMTNQKQCGVLRRLIMSLECLHPPFEVMGHSANI